MPARDQFRTITATDLESAEFQACEEEVRKYRRLFPNGVKPTRSNYQRARTMDLDWWVRKTEFHRGFRQEWMQFHRRLQRRYKERLGILQTWLRAGQIMADEYEAEQARIYQIFLKRRAWKLSEMAVLPEDGTVEPEIL